MVMNCLKCKTKMREKTSDYEEGIPYSYWSCPKCGEEVVDMRQLHDVAEKYRNLKQYIVTVSKWGDSDAIRIPRELTKKYRLKTKQTVRLIPEKTGIKIVAQ